MHATLFGDPSQYRNNEYKLWRFPNDNPFPALTQESLTNILDANVPGPPQRSGTFTWEDVIRTPHKHTPIEGLRKWRRWCWRILTLNGLLIQGYFFIKLTLGASIAWLLAQLWGAFLQKHVEAVFSDGTKEFPDWGQNLGMCIAVTAVAGIVPAMTMGIDWVYHTKCRRNARVRNIRRQSYTDLIEEARRHNAYMPSHEWDYDSDNDEPLPAYLYFLARDNQDTPEFAALWKFIDSKPVKPANPSRGFRRHRVDDDEEALKIF